MRVCYVGKATKIFFVVIAILAAAGIILGFGLLRHKSHRCDGGGCRASPTGPDPIPADATPSAPSDAGSASTEASPEVAAPPTSVVDSPPGSALAALVPAQG